MKTFLVIYMLAFVSIIVIYVHDQSSPTEHEYFNPQALAEQMLQLQHARGGISVKARPDDVPPGSPGESEGDIRRMELPEVVDTDEYPHTFEGLDQEIKELSVSAEVNPDLFVNVAGRYCLKAEMYRAAIEELEGTEPGRERETAREEFARKRIESLKLALEALEKAPRKIYKKTDIRFLKAWIYLDLPGQEFRAVAELEELVNDTDALPELRYKAQAMLEEYKLRK
jgi:hypothetical protein